MLKRNIFLEISENIALCQISKKYLRCVLFVTKGIWTMFATKVPIIKYSVFIVFNSCFLESRLLWVINDQFWMKLDLMGCVRHKWTHLPEPIWIEKSKIKG